MRSKTIRARIVDPPQNRFNGREFEAVTKEAGKIYQQNRVAILSKNGVHATRTSDGYKVQASKPDFTCDVARPLTLARHVLFDDKVCSQASFQLTKYMPNSKDNKRKQLEYLYDRAAFGVDCAMLLHWNPRKLATKSREPVTVWLPVGRHLDLWQEFERGLMPNLQFDQSIKHGRVVRWFSLKNGRKARPDFLDTICDLSESLNLSNTIPQTT